MLSLLGIWDRDGGEATAGGCGAGAETGRLDLKERVQI